LELNLIFLKDVILHILFYFILCIINNNNYGPGVNSASNINKYQEYFLGIKATGA